MNKQQAHQIIRETFESSFDKSSFSEFIKNFLNRIDDAPFTYRGNYIPDAFKQYIKTLERIGKFSDGENNIDILVITLQKETSLERARTMQRNFIAWYLNGSRGGEMKDAALAAYVSPDKEDWRFSLVKMDYKFEKTKTGKVKVKEEFTPARRWSFLVGANEKSHTAQTRLVNILANDEQAPTLKEIENAFDIETVTKEFFLKYRELFLRTKEELDKVIKENLKVEADFKKKSVDTVNFAKKLLGQIVFLYFLQKKGWFGVGRDDDWDTGSKHFLRELFEKKKSDYKNFYNDILEPLFYEALRIDRSYDDGYYSHFDCKIPFLNGGLFDPIGNYDWVHTDIIIPDKLFSNTDRTKEGDIGDGILDIFDRYNFTVKEDEPLEKEVAIDPELLGKAYEKFNAIRPDNYDEFSKALKSGKTGEENKFNKKFGVYYTPREIVHYICQQSLINYLATEMDGKASKEDIESLIYSGENVSENEETALIKEQSIKDGKQKSSEYKLKLPENIRNNVELIDQKLADITVCDPAVGSGAFPVGMMNEIVRARNSLVAFIQDNNRTSYEFKRHSIEHCLYGVDIDPGAVEIAKLRLWLSLVVDEEDIKNIKPLPNLDYKVMCGNSLLGIEKNLFNKQLFDELEKLKQLFFNETNPKKKHGHKKQIDKLISEITSGHTEFDFEIYFSEVFHNKGGFDVVIGNPPYFSLDAADISFKYYLKKMFPEVFSSQGNIYFFFIKKSIDILKKDGVLTFINENYYLSSKNAYNLRKYLVENTLLLFLINFRNAQLFENVNTLSLINSFRKTLPQANTILSRTIEDSVKSLDSEGILKFLSSLPNLIPQKNLHPKQWLLISGTKLALKDKIDKESIPLIQCVDMGQGMTSGNNDVFIVSKDMVSEHGFENKLLRKYIKTRDIKPYSLLYRNLFLIYTQKDIDIDKYPRTKKYLTRYRELLLNRFEVKSDPSRWFAISVQRNKRFFEDYDEKILTPLYSKGNKFAYDDCKIKNYFVLTDVYILVSKSKDYSLKYLLGLLNSKLFNYYIASFGKLKRDGYYEYSKNTLSQLPIKKDDSYEQILTLVDSILVITKDDDYLQNTQKQIKVNVLEVEIDQLVYKLYDLTPEEIKIVEGENEKGD